jgi:N-acetylmuramoyl-L-alanine amidase/type II secretory pathway predicted ATPase ExeA
MFLDFYQLREEPFGVTPDPAYLYPSRTHCEALDSLTEGIVSGRGFLALIAEPGLGKTTLLYQMLEGLRDTAHAAYLFQTKCNSEEFFQYLLSELGVDSTGMGLVAMHNKLNEMLLDEMTAGKRFVLIVDEAQNLDDAVLETIRLLSNFETSNTKLLQIILAGQPQLGEKLGQKGLEQLRQRITVVQHLEALSPEETAGYIRHRLRVAGHCGEGLFEPGALACVAERSQGVPRNINKICYRALLEAYDEGRHTVSPDIVEKAARSLAIDAPARPTPRPSPMPARVDSFVATRVAARPRRTYKQRAEFGFPGWGVWAAALAAVLLSASLALPRNMLQEMMQGKREQRTATFISALFHRDRGSADGHEGSKFEELSKSRAQREEANDRRQATNVSESAGSREGVAPQLIERSTPKVTSIQASSAEKDARVVVMLDDAIQYDTARISSPDRIYFDLYKARLSPSVAQKTVPKEEGVLKWVRAAQNKDEVVRLVLDAEGAKDYSAQLLSDPYRLVIDIHAQAEAGAERGLISEAAKHEVAKMPPEASASHESQLSLARELGLKINRIVIDPGHGGYDTGAKGPNGLLEKNLCLDVALRLGQLIEENIAGTEVIYTRKDDRHVPLEERTAIANDANADLLISIHANSSDFRQVRGAETYYLSLTGSREAMGLATRENELAQSSLHDLPDLIKKITSNEKIAESKLLAGDIQNALSQRLQLVSRRETNRGVKQAPFIVLTGANMPAVLSEISFVSNASDESLLLGSGQRQRVAEGLYRGIAAYLDSLHGLTHGKQKLVSENGASSPFGFATSTAVIKRNSP